MEIISPQARIEKLTSEIEMKKKELSETNDSERKFSLLENILLLSNEKDKIKDKIKIELLKINNKLLEENKKLNIKISEQQNKTQEEIKKVEAGLFIIFVFFVFLIF